MTAELLAGLWMLGAGLCVVLWLIAAWAFRQTRHESVLHQIVVLLTILTLVLFDVLIVLAVARVVTGAPFRLLFTFTLGIQAVAAIAAVIFARRAARAGRRP